MALQLHVAPKIVCDAPVYSFGKVEANNFTFGMIIVAGLVDGINPYKLIHYMNAHAVIAKILMSILFLAIAFILLLF